MGELCRENRAVSASWRREFFLLDRLQALNWQRLRKAKGREMAIKEVFGPAEADAMTR